MSNQATGEQPAKQPFRWTPRRIVTVVVAVYGLILVLLNLHRTEINFVFFKTEAPLLIVILLSLAVGFVLGWLFDDIRARHARKVAKQS